jgi:hypothetical protein
VAAVRERSSIGGPAAGSFQRLIEFRPFFVLAAKSIVLMKPIVLMPIVLILSALFIACAAMANGVAVTEFGPGSVRLQGSAESLCLEVHDSTIATVLAAMGRAFNVRYRSAIALGDGISGTYAGSLTSVIREILDGYDYGIKHKDSALEVAVFGRSRGRPVPPALSPPAITPVRHVRCGRSAGHRAACRSI